MGINGGVDECHEAEMIHIPNQKYKPTNAVDFKVKMTIL
jgi:hypothetical protein